MATSGTVGGGLFQKRLAEDGIQTVVPIASVQAKIMDAIYDIKNIQPARSRAAITAELVAAAETLVTEKSPSAQGIVAGCTEIPLALKAQDLSVPYFDALTILSRAAIRHAGLTPLSSH